MIGALLRLPDRIFSWIEPATTSVLSTLARLIFAAVLFWYFWNSGFTKVPDFVSTWETGAYVDAFKTLIEPSFNAFAQIYPKGAEAAGYDITQATQFQKIVIVAGTLAEFILPALIVVGLFTRAAAFGMIGFVVVQSLTDVYGHSAVLGSFFDAASDSALDQRAFWVFLLLYLVFRGAGPLSLDHLFRSERSLYLDDLQR